METQDRISIHYHGQGIEQLDRARIKANLAFHLGDAPSDASLCACVSKEEAGYSCNLRVHSANGHIFIHRESKDLANLMEFVYESMKLSFEKWHRDPNHFAKSHPLSKNPCKTAAHRNLRCPLQSFSAS